MIGSTFCPLPTSHIIIHIINHLVTFHVLQTMDDNPGLIPWQGRMNNLTTKDLIKRLLDIRSELISQLQEVQEW
jgi:hypothetical protein